MTSVVDDTSNAGDGEDEAVDRTPAVRRKSGLPASLSDIQRKSMRTYTLNDEVDRVLSVILVEDEDFRSYLEATDNQHSIEGTTRDDDGVAAALLRDKARQRSDLPLIKAATIKELRHSIGVVLGRLKSEDYPDGFRRSQRKPYAE